MFRSTMNNMKRLHAWMNERGSVDIRLIRLLAAGYIGVFLLTQLFTFEKFPQLIQGATGLEGAWVVVIAIVLVIAELMALPFLLGARISRLLQRVSQASGFIALGLLTIMEVLALWGDQSVLFGATFQLPSGMWSLLLLVAIWVLLMWSAIVSAVMVRQEGHKKKSGPKTRVKAKARKT